ncbi:MAG: aspartate:alanine exchanger family transporter [Opitutales bacterium]|jgi:putative transport protein
MNFQAIHQLLTDQPFIALFAVIASGLMLGSIHIKGIHIGSSGVLFTALLAGHLGYEVPGGIGTLGLVFFVYCVGIGAGGRFFPALAREGATLAKLALVTVSVGGLLTWAGATLIGLPADLATGIFAGSLTSTPALAAATEGLAQSGSQGVSIGYGIAYPFGVIGVVLFVQLLPRILKYDLEKLAADVKDPEGDAERVETVLVEVTNPNLAGKKIADAGLGNFNACQISRIYRDDRLAPLQYNDTFEIGQLLLLVGRSNEMAIAIDFLGKRSDRQVIKDVENERQQLLVTSRQFSGKSLAEIAPLKNFGIVITRVTRLGLTFVPNASTIIERNDQVTVVGHSDNLKNFSKAVGHRSSAIDTTDLLSLSAGLTLGIVVGLIPIGLPGSTPITLGLAGGPLLVAILLGHFGRVGRIVGHIPRPTRMLLQELGLVFFLASAGIRGGGSLLETVQSHGVSVFLLGIAVTIVPLLFSWPIARIVFKLNPLQALGGICGGMTSTPALGAITSRTESQVPVVSYVSAYPVALVIMILVAKALVTALG